MIQQNRVHNFYHNSHEGTRYIPLDELPDYTGEAYMDGYRQGCNKYIFVGILGFGVGFLLSWVMAL